MTRNEILEIVKQFYENNVTEREVAFARFVMAKEREACAQVCEEKQQYAMPIPCPDGIDGCSVMHCVPARREKTGQECAEAIRAREEK